MNSPHVLFQWLRWQLFRNNLFLVRERSMLRAITILLCSLLVWGSLFAISYQGFREIRVRFDWPLDGPLLGFVFDMMFLALTLLLIFSTGIILYSSLFASVESNFLLCSPVPSDHIFAYKLQGAMAFSSWAFVLLGSPILIAYGLNVSGGAPWYFYLSLPLFFLGFVLIPGTLGGLMCLILVNILPRHRKQVLIMVGIGVLMILAVWLWRWAGLMRAAPFGSRDWFATILRELGPMSSVWFPSHWISRGLQMCALGELNRAAYYLALVWSNGLMLYVLAVALAAPLYRRGFNRMASGGNLRKKYGGQWLDRGLDHILFFLGPQTRLLIIKDFRTFRRDPAQWFQILIFLQLAVLYFYNMRRFYEQEIGRAFQNGISLLTLTATAFLMCAYTGRFIYPMLSLEGKKFWILGLLPLDRDRLLWGKFAFSATGGVIVAEFLVIFSNYMLSMPPLVTCVHALTIAVLASGLSGLSVGLGACMPNFRENDPSKIAVGFGGTLNLIACLLMLIVVIFFMALPIHLDMARDPGLERSLSWRVLPGIGIGIIVGGLATVLPLRAGIRTLRNMEF